MTIAAPFPLAELFATEKSEANFHPAFALAPFPAARLNSKGVLLEMNAAFRQVFGPELSDRPTLHLSDLAALPQRDKVESLLRDLFGTSHDIPAVAKSTIVSASGVRFFLWRESSGPADLPHALLIGEISPEARSDEADLQAQRWEAMGRLTGGVAHDFNNLLTGVMLYCDLLLSSMDPRDRRRRYADEIRNAVVQASALVSQLLVFARPQPGPARPLLLNDVLANMRDLLTRLIGENISLDLRLDPELGLVTIDQAQAQQVLLNLVLNARDALPNGGRILIETSNCNFQPLGGSIPRTSTAAFPCVLLVVSDNGIGMSEETRRRLFEPFFTTKNGGRGTGLGLTTVSSIVTTHRGLIHFESEPGSGTRAMILLPRAVPGAASPLRQTMSISQAPFRKHFRN